MVDVFLQTVQLLWHWFLAQPPAALNSVVPWHLPALLCLLGLLATFGLHRLLHPFWRKGKVFAWVSGALVFGVLVISIQVWLLAYLLLTQGEALVQHAMRSTHPQSATRQMGRILLAPLFITSKPAALPTGKDTQPLGFSQLTARLQAQGTLEYQQEVEKQLRPWYTLPHYWAWGPNQLGTQPSSTQPSSTQPPPHEQWLTQLALHWLIHLEPHVYTAKSLPSRVIRWLGKGDDVTRQKSLSEWQRVVGFNFFQHGFAQVLTELLTWSVGAVCVLVLVFNGLLLTLSRLCMRWFGVLPSAKKTRTQAQQTPPSSKPKQPFAAADPNAIPQDTVGRVATDSGPIRGTQQAKDTKSSQPTKRAWFGRLGQQLGHTKKPLGWLGKKSVAGAQQGSKWATQRGGRLGRQGGVLGKGFLRRISTRMQRWVEDLEASQIKPAKQGTASPKTATCAASTPAPRPTQPVTAALPQATTTTLTTTTPKTPRPASRRKPQPKKPTPSKGA